MLRFLFWFCMSVIMAYFMTDIKIGGRTIKEIIDGYLHTQSGIELQEKAKGMLESGLKDIVEKVISQPTKSEPSNVVNNATEAKQEPNPSQPNAQDSDDLRPEDQLELQKILKANH